MTDPVSFSMQHVKDLSNMSVFFFNLYLYVYSSYAPPQQQQQDGSGQQQQRPQKLWKAFEAKGGFDAEEEIPWDKGYRTLSGPDPNALPAMLYRSNTAFGK